LRSESSRLLSMIRSICNGSMVSLPLCSRMKQKDSAKFCVPQSKLIKNGSLNYLDMFGDVIQGHKISVIMVRWQQIQFRGFLVETGVYQQLIYCQNDTHTRQPRIKTVRFKFHCLQYDDIYGLVAKVGATRVPFDFYQKEFMFGDNEQAKALSMFDIRVEILHTGNYVYLGWQNGQPYPLFSDEVEKARPLSEPVYQLQQQAAIVQLKIGARAIEVHKISVVAIHWRGRTFRGFLAKLGGCSNLVHLISSGDKLELKVVKFHFHEMYYNELNGLVAKLGATRVPFDFQRMEFQTAGHNRERRDIDCAHDILG